MELEDYLHNKVEVERYVTDWIEHGERMRAEQHQNPSSAKHRLQQLKTNQLAQTSTFLHPSNTLFHSFAHGQFISMIATTVTR